MKTCSHKWGLSTVIPVTWLQKLILYSPIRVFPITVWFTSDLYKPLLIALFVIYINLWQISFGLPTQLITLDLTVQLGLLALLSFVEGGMCQLSLACNYQLPATDWWLCVCTFLTQLTFFRRPVMSLTGPTKPTLAVRFCPILFELRKIPRQTTDKPAGKTLIMNFQMHCNFCKFFLCTKRELIALL